MARAYYNEFDHAAAHILRALIDDGVLAPGDVDTRSIKEVMPDDLDGYTQCHFFAGGGLWSVAARLAGWPDERSLWTGSCPCQPFSAAGKGLGTDDPRHLWPDFHRLIRARRPAVVMGEQVAGAPGYGWFDGVRSDLEGEGYASRAVDFPACAVDAPHQRNRLYWIAVPNGTRDVENPDSQQQRWGRHPHCGPDRDHAGAGPVNQAPGSNGSADRLYADTDSGGRTGWTESSIGETFERTALERSVLRNGTHWSDAEWFLCHDGKARRTQPGIRFLVDGLPGRVDLWRVGGNAIVPEAAAEVIAAYLDTERAAP